MISPLMIPLVVIGFSIVCLVMSLLWILSVRMKNAGIVDIGWASCLIVLAWVYAENSDGYLPRRLIIFTLVFLWGYRLVSMLIRRIMRDKSEDKRYQKIRESWKTNLNLKFLFFFLFQGALDVILAIPFLLICFNPRTQIVPIEIVGISIWIVGFLGEIIADDQLNFFVKDPQNKGKVCQFGLWKYSRHPNYFFEWLMWVGYFIFAISAPLGWLAFIAPVLMYHFLRNVSGVPLAEEQSLRSRGEEYRRYQKTTSVFFPWFTKKI